MCQRISFLLAVALVAISFPHVGFADIGIIRTECLVDQADYIVTGTIKDVFAVSTYGVAETDEEEMDLRIRLSNDETPRWPGAVRTFALYSPDVVRVVEIDVREVLKGPQDIKRLYYWQNDFEGFACSGGNVYSLGDVALFFLSKVEVAAKGDARRPVRITDEKQLSAELHDTLRKRIGEIPLTRVMHYGWARMPLEYVGEKQYVRYGSDILPPEGIPVTLIPGRNGKFIPLTTFRTLRSRRRAARR